MPSFKEKDLSKGDLRKLKAIRKSLGDKIADDAFAIYLSEKSKKPVIKMDQNAELIRILVEKDILDGKIKLPNKGYIIKRGRRKVKVEKVI
jgi:hypothetical protein